MPLITITSDWNKNDCYLPVLKGRLHSLCGKIGEACQTVDVSNSVKPFDLFEACFILKHSFLSFPQGTIHIIAVGESPLSSGKITVAKAMGHYFIGVDDGKFQLLFNHPENVEAYSAVCGGSDGPFAEAECFCEAVEAIMCGKELETAALQRGGAERAVVMIDKIIGRIVYIDSYGNAITNISQSDFLKVYDMVEEAGGIDSGDGPDFVVYVGGPHLKFNDIHDWYNSVAPGNEVVIFNSLGLLEIAVNRGNFAVAEGVDTTTEVLVKFK